MNEDRKGYLEQKLVPILPRVERVFTPNIRALMLEGEALHLQVIVSKEGVSVVVTELVLAETARPNRLWQAGRNWYTDKEISDRDWDRIMSVPQRGETIPTFLSSLRKSGNKPVPEPRSLSYGLRETLNLSLSRAKLPFRLATPYVHGKRPRIFDEPPYRIYHIERGR